MNFRGTHCNSDESHECSEPSEITDPTSKLKPILSPGNLNYQMFAYNPVVNHKNCGLSEDDSNQNMTLTVTTQKKQIKSSTMKYREGTPDYRKYDACYY